jgi:hypothetical protein
MSFDLASKLHTLAGTLVSKDARDVARAAAFALEVQAKQPDKQPDNRPFWIVMAMDSPGPVQDGLNSYVRQPDEATAKSEARRLAGIHGGRFAVLRAMHVIGWHEVQMDAADLQLPF